MCHAICTVDTRLGDIARKQRRIRLTLGEILGQFLRFSLKEFSMDEWGERQLNSNKLIRFCMEYLLKNKITYKKIHSLCKLTWITNGADSENTSYLKSTKLPALSEIFDSDFINKDFKEIAEIISQKINKSVKEVKPIIEKHSGYTNFYKAYRNSSEKWIQKNFDEIQDLVKMGYNLKSDLEGEKIIKRISILPKIPKANNSQSMKPEYLLTPLIFSLDERLRFPLLNGNEGVKTLLRKLKVQNQSLLAQFKEVSQLIGQGDIKTSIDIDRLGGDLPEFVSINNLPPNRKKLKPRNLKNLDLKDEEDINVLKTSLTNTAKRLHNKMTNLLLEKFSMYSLHEGNRQENKFDVLVKNVPESKNDLLIEVKTSSEVANLRMALGQLFDYSRQLPNYENTYLSIFLPELPNKNGLEFLEFYEISLIWLEGETIYSNNKHFPFRYKKT
jgi:hypothetical protein